MKNYECLGYVFYGFECLTKVDTWCHRMGILVCPGNTGTDVLFGLVLRLSPTTTKLWPVASGPWHLP
jgi:hypothetical protein